MAKKLWKAAVNTLKSIPNPKSGYEQFIDIPEFTFLGVGNQPDFGHIKIWFHGDAKTIELKSLKEYLFQYRDIIISYERFMDVFFNHLREAYEPFRVRVEVEFRPRGGISSTLKADTDWGHFGGSDKLWQTHKD